MSLLHGWVTNAFKKFLGQHHFFNGTFRESFDALVTSDGVTITMTLEQSGGGDLTMNFSNGPSLLDCTPAQTIALTAGTDEIPQINYIYILQSTKVLTKSTSDWPAAEHIRVSRFFVQSASLVNTGAAGDNWVLVNHNWNDHAANTNNQGHMSEIADRERKDGAKWDDGCEGTATNDGNDCWVAIAAGHAYQMHRHTFDALDSDTDGAGDKIVVINDPDAAYTQINSLNEITKDASGVLLGNNKFYKLPLLGVINKSGEVSPMGVLLPTGTYNTAEGASRDVDGKAVFAVPTAFADTAFFVAALILQHTTAATSEQSTIDLRGQISPNVIGSGTGGGDVTAGAALTDNAAVRGDGGAKGVQTSGVLIDDNDDVTGMNSLVLGTALAVGSGGTGFTSYAAGDQVAGSGGVLAKITLGTIGKLWTAGATLPGWQYAPRTVMMQAQPDSNAIWTNMPAAVTFYQGSLNSMTIVDLTHCTQVRLSLLKRGTAGAAGSTIILRYHTSFASVVGTFSDIGTSEVSVAIDVAASMPDSGWINLAAGAKAEVFTILLGEGGDGAVDPAFGNIVAHYR
jgi:hypothetical protein